MVWFLGLLLTSVFSMLSADMASGEAYASRVAELGGRFTHVAVIGGGCAGLSAGFTVAYLKHSTVIFTGDKPGGQLMGSQLVENIPGMPPLPGYRVMETLQEQAEQQGALVVYETVIDVHYESVEGKPLFVLTAVKDSKDPEEMKHPRVWCTLSVIFAMGGVPRTLGVSGESDYLNKQVFTCAVCDGRVAENKEAYIVGGGDASVDTIMTLFSFGARRCTLVVRGNKLRAAPALQQRLLKQAPDEMQIHYNTRVVEVRGGENGMHTIVLEGPEGRTEISAEVLFYAIGHEPVTSYPWVRRHVACDNQGYIIVQGDQSTTFPGIFAAGDIASPQYHKASYAMGCAQHAAESAVQFSDQYLTPQLKLLSDKP